MSYHAKPHPLDFKPSALFFDMAGTLCDIPIGNIWEDINLDGIERVWKKLGIESRLGKAEGQRLSTAFVQRKAVLRKDAKDTLKEHEIKKQIMDFLKTESLAEGIDTSPEFWLEVEKEFITPELDITIPFEDAVPVLERLSKEYPLYLLSNNASSVLVHEITEKCGLTSFIKGTFVSCDIGWRKPDIRFLEAVLKETGLTAPESVMIGDRLTQDILMANKTGMPGIFAAMTEHEDNHGADHISYSSEIHSLSDLLEILPGITA